MTGERLSPSALVGISILALAVTSGALVGRLQDPKLVVGGLGALALVVVAFEAPLVGYFLFMFALGAVPELSDDDLLLGLSAYSPVPTIVTIPAALLMLVGAALLLTSDLRGRWWPGPPATIALALIVVAAANIVWFSPSIQGVYTIRPLLLLMGAMLVGYWVSLRYGSRPAVAGFVLAGVVAIPGGLYNRTLTEFSYYDSSLPFLIGMAAVLLMFRVVDPGPLRWPLVALAVLVVGLSLRRGAIVTVAIALLVAALFFSRGKLRAGVGAFLVLVVVVEILVPEFALTQLETFTSYFAGTTSDERNVAARHWETANAWLNIKRTPVFGIGPTADWILLDTAQGQYLPAPDVRNYLHNSYLAVWLRNGLIGLIVFISFFVVSARSLLRPGAPRVTVIAGGAVVGLAVGLVTASFLTTTTRWPMTVGMLIGIGLAALRMHGSEPVEPAWRESAAS